MAEVEDVSMADAATRDQQTDQIRPDAEKIIVVSRKSVFFV